VDYYGFPAWSGEIPDKFRKALSFFIPENHVYARNGGKSIGVAFRIAAGNDQARPGIVPVQTAYGLAHLLIGTVRDGAGIHHNQVGIGRGSGFRHRQTAEPMAQRGAIGLIAAAPEGHE